MALPCRMISTAFSVCTLIAFLSSCQSDGPGDSIPLAPVARTTDSPDIILISIDSLRYDHLGCYGYSQPTSPTIDRIAAEGAIFTNAVSTTSWTLPSHAAMFTGLYDSTHGVIDNGHRLDEDFVTLAETLRDTGYRTAGFYGGPYLHPTFGLNQGFDTYGSAMTQISDDFSGEEVRESAMAIRGASHADITGPRTIEEVSKWLHTINGQPFFLFLHLWDVHYDYIPPKRYVEIFDPDYTGTLDGHNFYVNQDILPGMPERDLQHLLALYDGEIRFTDDTLGTIFELLKKTGRFSDSIVVITADHGEEFFEHGGKGHHQTLFDEVIRVPLIIRWPDHIPGGLVIPDQVRLIDLMPTLLALSGVSNDQTSQGRDVGPLLRGDSLIPEPALAELLLDGRNMRALRTNHNKFISYDNHRNEFFDLDIDPYERHPLPPDDGQYPKVQRELRLLTESAQRLGKYLASDAETETKIDLAMCRRLRALGYIESSADCNTNLTN